MTSARVGGDTFMKGTLFTLPEVIQKHNLFIEFQGSSNCSNESMNNSSNANSQKWGNDGDVRKTHTRQTVL